MKNLIDKKLEESKLVDGGFDDEYAAADVLLSVVLDGWAAGARKALKKIGLDSSEIKEIEKDVGRTIERFLDRSAQSFIDDLAGSKAATRLSKG